MTWVLTFVMLLGLIPYGAFSVAEAAEKEMWEIALEEKYLNYDTVNGCGGTGHLQGICVDDKMEYMYFSYTDALIKVSLETGKVVGSIGGFGAGGFGTAGGAHLGCLAYYDGMIYGSLEYKSPGKKFFICAFDEDVITTTGMDIKDIQQGVYGILLQEPTEDFRDPLNDTAYAEADGFAANGSSKGHAFACSGIDGVTFGTIPGDTSGKMYMMVAYGVYGTSAAEWQNRYDNDYNVIHCYDPAEFEVGDSCMRRFTYERGTSNVVDIAGGEYLSAAESLYVWTGNTNYGVQNLEYDKDTGDIVMFTYGATKPYNSGSLFIIDGSVAPVMKTLEVGQNNVDTDAAVQAAAKEKAKSYMIDTDGDGTADAYPQAKHLTLKCICGSGLDSHSKVCGESGVTASLCSGGNPASSSMGAASIGNKYYYLCNGSYTTGLYQRDDSYKFTKVTVPVAKKLLVDLSMDAADLYEKNGVVYMKNAADATGANDAIVEGTVPAAGVQGGAGSALYFDAWKYPNRVDQVYLSADTIEMINEAAETAIGNGSYSYSFWYEVPSGDKADANFLPVLGFYREDNTYANIIQHRWSSSLGNCINGIGGNGAGAGNINSDTYNPSNLNPGDNNIYIQGYCDNAWHHIVVTEAAGDVTIYMDGAYYGKNSASSNHLMKEPFVDFIIGGGKGKVWQDMNNRGRVIGAIDDVQIWSGVLTAQEVADMYAAKPANAQNANAAHPGVVTPAANNTVYLAYDKTDDAGKDLSHDYGVNVESLTLPNLTKGTDYTVSGNVLTLKASWLAAQECGKIESTAGGITTVLTITDRKTPVLKFALDKASVTGNVVADSSVYGMNATTTSTSFAKDRNDAADGAMVFNGYDYKNPTYVKLDEHNADWLNSVIKNGYTMTFWANAGAENGTRMAFAGLFAADARPLGVVETNDGDNNNGNIDGKLKVQVNIANASKTSQDIKPSTTVADKNTWVMYTATYDKATNMVKLYADNEQVAFGTVSNDIIGSIDQLFIGHMYEKYSGYGTSNKWLLRGGFYGSIADFAMYNYALSETEIGELYGAAVESEPTIADVKPIVHWTMDGSSVKADGTIVDSSENNLLGYYENVTSVAGKDGTANSALYFDGTADSGDWSRVWLSDAGITEINKDIGNQVTMGFWVKPDTTKTNHKTAYTGAWSPIIGLYGANGQYLMTAEDRSGTLCYCTTVSGDKHTKANGALNAGGNWYYVVMTYDGDVSETIDYEWGGTQESRYRRIWIFDAQGNALFSGGQRRSVGSGVYDAIESFEVGGQYYKAWTDTNVRGRFVGAIDDVRLYNVAVDEADAKIMASLVVNNGGTPAYAPEAEEAPIYFTAGSLNKTGEIADVTVTATAEVKGTIQSVTGLPSPVYTISGNSIVIKGSYLMLQQPGALEFTVTTSEGTYPAAVYITNGGTDEVEPYPVLYYKMDKADLTSTTAANGTISGTVKDYSGNGIDAQFEGIKTSNADKDKAADKSLFFDAYQETDSTRMYLDAAGMDYLSSVIDEDVSYSFWFSSKRISSNYMPVIGVYGADNRPLAVAQFVATGSERPGANPTQLNNSNQPKGTDPVASFLAMPAGKNGTADGEYKDDATIVMRDAAVWHHYVMTYTGSTGAFAIYMDGALVHSGTAAKDQLDALAKFEMGGLSNPNYYNISSRSTQTRGRLEGNVDEVKVFNVALDADNVSKLYAAGVASNLPAEDPTNISDITNEFGLAVVDGLVVKVEGLNGPVEGAKVELPANLPVETVKVILPDGTPSNTYTKVTVAEFNGDLSVGKAVTVQENASSTRTGEVTDESGVVEYLTTFQDGDWSVEGNDTVKFDGEAHESATVTNDVGAAITYYVGNDNYTSVPSFTDVGKYTVRYVVSKTGYEDETGSYEFEIEKSDITGFEIKGNDTVKFDGEAHESATVTTGVPADATITYTVGNDNSTEVPKFTAVGKYTVNYVISKEGYNDVTGSYEFTIEKGDITGYSIVANDTVTYDGEEHTSASAAAGVPADATITYKWMEDGQEQTSDAVPAFTDAGTYQVSYTISKEGYNDVEGSYEFTVEPAKVEPEFKPGEKAEYTGKPIPVAEIISIPEGAVYAFALLDENGDAINDSAVQNEVLTVTEVGKYEIVFVVGYLDGDDVDENYEVFYEVFNFEVVEPAPETGDNAALGLWLAMLTLSAAAGIILVLRRRKEQA